MKISSRMLVLIAVMAAFAGYHAWNKRTAGVRDQLSASVQELAAVPATLTSLPGELTAAGLQLETVLAKATSNVAVGINDLQLRF